MTREKELILVVDDSPTNLAILNVVLREVYNVVTATNGPDALNLAASEEPDLIILDIMMPGMDGYEICDRLKANPFTKDIPVMFVTAMDQERQEAKGLAMGAVDYLAKPVSPPIVLARVRNQLELKKQRDFLRRLSSVDGLTGVANRRSFNDTFGNEWRRCARASAPMSVIMIDIDHFKSYNDAYGHQAGDACLQAVASAMKHCAGRPQDMLARYGGEEFVLLLPNVAAQGAESVAQHILQEVRTLAIPHRMSTASEIVTVSIGAATQAPCEGGNPEMLIRTADSLLYQAKKSGRNRYCAA